MRILLDLFEDLLQFLVGQMFDADEFVVGIGHGAARRHWHAGGGQQLFGELLVLCNGFGNGAGGVNLCSLDAALFAAPAKLDQAALCQAANGNAVGFGRIDDGVSSPSPRPGAAWAEICERRIG